MTSWRRSLERLYLGAPQSVLDAAQPVYRALTVVRGLRLQTLRFGSDPGRPRLTYHGRDRETALYLSRWLPAGERTVRPGPPVGLPEAVRRLRGARTEEGLVVVQTAAELARLAHRSAHRAPAWLGSWLPCHRSIGELRAGNKGLKNDLRTVRRNALQIVEDTSESGFLRFYSDYYLPYLESRFGAEGIAYGRLKLQRLHRRGVLLWSRAGGRNIAGGLLRRAGGRFHMVSFGTEGGSLEPVRLGAFSGLYVHALQMARSAGARELDVGGVRPFLEDGVLRHKAKFRLRVGLKGNCLEDLLLSRAPAALPALESILERSPILVRHGDGSGDPGLVALVSSTGGPEHRRLPTGVHGLRPASEEAVR